MVFQWWSKKALSRVRWAVEDLKRHEQQVREHVMDATEARSAAIAMLSEELMALRSLNV